MQPIDLQQRTHRSIRWLACTHRVKHKEIRVYECVYEYEYGQRSGANALPTYSYTYSYTPISPFPDTQVLHLSSLYR